MDAGEDSGAPPAVAAAAASGGAAAATDGAAASAAAQRLTSLLRGGAVVGQFIQTEYQRRWYDGRVVDAFVAADGGLDARVQYSTSQEDVRLDDAHGGPNRAVKYALGARLAWLKVHRFPWWPALQLVHSWAVAERRVPEGDGTGRASFRFLTKELSPDAIARTHDIAHGQPRVSLASLASLAGGGGGGGAGGRGEGKGKSASSAAAAAAAEAAHDGGVALRAPINLAPPGGGWYPSDRETLQALGEAPRGGGGGGRQSASAAAAAGPQPPPLLFEPDLSLLEDLATTRADADRRHAAALAWCARTNAATLGDAANALALARSHAELARACALSAPPPVAAVAASPAVSAASPAAGAAPAASPRCGSLVGSGTASSSYSSNPLLLLTGGLSFGGSGVVVATPDAFVGRWVGWWDHSYSEELLVLSSSSSSSSSRHGNSEEVLGLAMPAAAAAAGGPQPGEVAFSSAGSKHAPPTRHVTRRVEYACHVLARAEQAAAAKAAGALAGVSSASPSLEPPFDAQQSPGPATDALRVDSSPAAAILDAASQHGVVLPAQVEPLDEPMGAAPPIKEPSEAVPTVNEPTGATPPVNEPSEAAARVDAPSEAALPVDAPTEAAGREAHDATIAPAAVGASSEASGPRLGEASGLSHLDVSATVASLAPAHMAAAIESPATGDVPVVARAAAAVTEAVVATEAPAADAGTTMGPLATADGAAAPAAQKPPAKKKGGGAGGRRFTELAALLSSHNASPTSNSKPGVTAFHELDLSGGKGARRSAAPSSLSESTMASGGSAQRRGAAASGSSPTRQAKPSNARSAGSAGKKSSEGAGLGSKKKRAQQPEVATASSTAGCDTLEEPMEDDDDEGDDEAVSQSYDGSELRYLPASLPACFVALQPPVPRHHLTITPAPLHETPSLTASGSAVTTSEPSAAAPLVIDTSVTSSGATSAWDGDVTAAAAALPAPLAPAASPALQRGPPTVSMGLVHSLPRTLDHLPAPSARGRWVIGWVARYCGKSKRHLVVFDTPPVAAARAAAAGARAAGTPLIESERTLASLDSALALLEVAAPAAPSPVRLVSREWLHLSDDTPGGALLLPSIPSPLPFADPLVLAEAGLLPPASAAATPLTCDGASPVYSASLASAGAQAGYTSSSRSQQQQQQLPPSSSPLPRPLQPRMHCDVCLQHASAADPLLACCGAVHAALAPIVGTDAAPAVLQAAAMTLGLLGRPDPLVGSSSRDARDGAASSLGANPGGLAGCGRAVHVGCMGPHWLPPPAFRVNPLLSVPGGGGGNTPSASVPSSPNARRRRLAALSAAEAMSRDVLAVLPLTAADEVGASTGPFVHDYHGSGSVARRPLVGGSSASLGAAALPVAAAASSASRGRLLLPETGLPRGVTALADEPFAYSSFWPCTSCRKCDACAANSPCGPPARVLAEAEAAVPAHAASNSMTHDADDDDSPKSSEAAAAPLAAATKHSHRVGLAGAASSTPAAPSACQTLQHRLGGLVHVPTGSRRRHLLTPSAGAAVAGSSSSSSITGIALGGHPGSHTRGASLATGLSAPAASAHSSSAALHASAPSWELPATAVARRSWGLHSFAPIPGTQAYTARRKAAAQAAAVAKALGMGKGAGGVVQASQALVPEFVDASGVSVAAGVDPSLAVPPADAPFTMLTCAACTERLGDGAFCAACHGVYHDDDVGMVACNGCDGWFHTHCDGMSNEELVLIERGTHPLWGREYACPACRNRKLARILSLLAGEDRAGHFSVPVTADMAPGYFSIITHPSDLHTMAQRLSMGAYDTAAGTGLQRFRSDFELIVRNALVFNTPQDAVYRDAWRFLKAGSSVIDAQLPGMTSSPPAHVAEFAALRAVASADPMLASTLAELPPVTSTAGAAHARPPLPSAAASTSTQSHEATQASALTDATLSAVVVSNDAAAAGSSASVEEQEGVSVAAAGPGILPPSSGNISSSRFAALNATIARKSTIGRVAGAPEHIEGTPEELQPLPLDSSASAVDAAVVMAELRLDSRTAPLLALQDVCAICGGAGDAHLMLPCVDCGEAYHAYCAAPALFGRLVAAAESELMFAAAAAAGVSALPLRRSGAASTAAASEAPPPSLLVGAATSSALASASLAASVAALGAQGWRCPSCKVCELCGCCDPAHEGLLLVCDGCEGGYHTFCLSPRLVSIPDCPTWLCRRCVACTECGAHSESSPMGTWSFSPTLCYSCHPLSGKARAAPRPPSSSALSSSAGSGVPLPAQRPRVTSGGAAARDAAGASSAACPVCTRQWDANDHNMICCNDCQGWTHYACDPDALTPPALQVHNSATHAATLYQCPPCRASHRRRVDEGAAAGQQQQHFAQRVHAAMSSTAAASSSQLPSLVAGWHASLAATEPHLCALTRAILAPPVGSPQPSPTVLRWARSLRYPSPLLAAAASTGAGLHHSAALIGRHRTLPLAPAAAQPHALHAALLTGLAASRLPLVAQYMQGAPGGTLSAAVPWLLPASNVLAVAQSATPLAAHLTAQLCSPVTLAQSPAPVSSSASLAAVSSSTGAPTSEPYMVASSGTKRPAAMTDAGAAAASGGGVHSLQPHAKRMRMDATGEGGAARALARECTSFVDARALHAETLHVHSTSKSGRIHVVDGSVTAATTSVDDAVAATIALPASSGALDSANGRRLLTLVTGGSSSSSSRSSSSSSSSHGASLQVPDPRFCALCGQAGDCASGSSLLLAAMQATAGQAHRAGHAVDHAAVLTAAAAGIEGRLLPLPTDAHVSTASLLPPAFSTSALASLQSYGQLHVHSLCAYWSNDVGVQHSSSTGVGLTGVFKALRRARTAQCVHCGQAGASVACRGRHGHCAQVLHLRCAVLAGMSFDLSNKSVWCSAHVRAANDRHAAAGRQLAASAGAGVAAASSPRSDDAASGGAFPSAAWLAAHAASRHGSHDIRSGIYALSMMNHAAPLSVVPVPGASGTALDAPDGPTATLASKLHLDGDFGTAAAPRLLQSLASCSEAAFGPPLHEELSSSVTINDTMRERLDDDVTQGGAGARGSGSSSASRELDVDMAASSNRGPAAALDSLVASHPSVRGHSQALLDAATACIAASRGGRAPVNGSPPTPAGYPVLRVGALTVLRWGRIVKRRAGYNTHSVLFPVGYAAVRLWWAPAPGASASPQQAGSPQQAPSPALVRAAYRVDVLDAFGDTEDGGGTAARGGGAGPVFAITCLADASLRATGASPDAALTALRHAIVARTGGPASAAATRLLSRAELLQLQPTLASSREKTGVEPVVAPLPGCSELSGSTTTASASPLDAATYRSHALAPRLLWQPDTSSGSALGSDSDAYGLQGAVWFGLAVPAVQACLETLPGAALAMITPSGTSGWWPRYRFRHVAPSAQALVDAREFRTNGGSAVKAPLRNPAGCARLALYDRTLRQPAHKGRTLMAAGPRSLFAPELADADALAMGDAQREEEEGGRGGEGGGAAGGGGGGMSPTDAGGGGSAAPTPAIRTAGAEGSAAADASFEGASSATALALPSLSSSSSSQLAATPVDLATLLLRVPPGAPPPPLSAQDAAAATWLVVGAPPPEDSVASAAAGDSAGATGGGGSSRKGASSGSSSGGSSSSSAPAASRALVPVPLTELVLAAMFRRMRASKAAERLVVRRSPIHGWGLFLRLDLPKDAMLIEYTGQLVRQPVADRREVLYEEWSRLGKARWGALSPPPPPPPLEMTPGVSGSSSGSGGAAAAAQQQQQQQSVLFANLPPGVRPNPVGPDRLVLAGPPLGDYVISDGSGSCYLFRRDEDWIVDATRVGSAARFVNHRCEPNCYSRVVTVEGEARIVIMALRDLRLGEELTYNYKFAVEADPRLKIPCYCGAPSCVGTMN